MDLRQVLVILMCIQFALAIFIPSAKHDFMKKSTPPPADSKYSDLLRDLAVIKLKLETMGFGPVFIDGPYDNGPMAKSIQDKELPITAEDPPASSQFNEMEVLELVPVIIEQKRKGNISPDEEVTLKEIFGDLWIVIEEEVNRAEGEEMNPILRALLQSHDNRLKRALVQQRQYYQQPPQEHNEDTGMEVEEKNDIFGNSVDRVRVTRWPRNFIELNQAELSPQQRLMRHAALLIRQWFDENSSRSPRRSVGAKRNQRRKKKNIKGRRSGGNRRNRNRNGGGVRRKKNLRPKRHNTDIFVDDNHDHDFDYEADYVDFYAVDDMMTKPLALRNSIRGLFDEYDSNEEGDEVEEDDGEKDDDEYDIDI